MVPLQDVVDHGPAFRHAVRPADLHLDLPVGIQLLHRSIHSRRHPAGVGVADPRLGGVGHIVLFQGGQIQVGGGEQVPELFIGEHVVDGSLQIRFLDFRFFGHTGPNEYSLGFGMEHLHRPAPRNHGRNGTRHIGHQLVVQPADHGDPHRAAAAGQLEVSFLVDVLVKFQSFLQGQDIGEHRHFQHPGKTQQLQGRPQLAGGDFRTELAGEGRSHQGINGGIPLLQFFHHGNDILLGLQGFQFAGIHTGLAAHAFVRIDLDPIGTGMHGVPLADLHAVRLLVFRTSTGLHPPHQAGFFRMGQTFDHLGIGVVDVFHILPFRRPFQHLVIQFIQSQVFRFAVFHFFSPRQWRLLHGSNPKPEVWSPKSGASG